MAFQSPANNTVEEAEASAIMWSGLSEGGGGILTLFSKLCHTFLAFIPETVNSLSVQMKTVSCEWTMPGSGPYTLWWLTVNSTTVGLDDHLHPLGKVFDLQIYPYGFIHCTFLVEQVDIWGKNNKTVSWILGVIQFFSWSAATNSGIIRLFHISWSIMWKINLNSYK